MSYKIFNLKNKTEWNNYLSKLPDDQQDIYFRPEYYNLYEKNGDGKARCFVFEKDGEIAIYPFLIKKVNELGFDLDDEYYDIQGAYGYSGIAGSSYDPNFIQLFYNKFEDYCQENNVIAEFVRFNPIIGNHKFFYNNNSVYKVNKNIIVDLNKNDIWNSSYRYSTRKNIKKAKRNNLYCKYYFGDEINDTLVNKFIKIYYKTMDRVNANDYYYFSKKFFYDIKSNLLGNVIFFFIHDYEDNVISAEIVPFNKNIGYSYLGGTLSQYFDKRPNDLLKHSIIKTLKNINVNYYCLGGGKEIGDGIYMYKKSFAKNGSINFYIGKKIHKKKIYDTVVNQWENKFPEKKEEYKNILLKYHE